MTNSFTSDDLEALVTFPFKDPQWKEKFLVGFLIVLAGFFIPWLPMIFVYGYCAQIMRRIIVEQGTPYLPKWDDWGKLFFDGLKLFGVGLVYSLPMMVLFCGGYGLFFMATMWPGMISTGNEVDPSTPVFWVPPVLGMIGWVATLGIGMVLFFLMGLILPVAVGHVIATDEFAAAFRFSEWWAIFRANLGGFIFAYILLFGFWMVLVVAMQILYFTIIFCCLVPFVMAGLTVYVMVIASVLFAQAYQTGANKLNTA